MIQSTPTAAFEIGSLSRLGFQSPSDCLLAVPKEYRDFTHPIDRIQLCDLENKHAYILKFVSFQMYDKAKTLTKSMRECFRLSMTFKDVDGTNVFFSVFGGAFSWKDVIYDRSGQSTLLWGRAELFNGYPTLKEVELVSPSLFGKILPVYAGKIGRVSAAKVHEGVVKAAHLVEESAMTLISKMGLRDVQFTNYAGMPAREFLQKLHWPATAEIGNQAKSLSSKLAVLGLVQSAVDYRIKTPNQKSSIKISGESVAQLISTLPFPLTNDQTQSIQKIVQGLREPFPSLDLISADVGVGKSIVFMIPAAAAAMAGAKVGIMAPTMLLADQLYNEMVEYFPQLSIGIVKPAGKITADISIGTTAIIGAAKRSKVEFALVVVDEQHKFGSEQRASLIHAHTNLIESTATPIPRSVALVLFGGYRLIHMTECPVKKSIFTRVVARKDGKTAFEFITKIIGEGGQVAVVYPAVESTGDAEGKTVKDAAVRWEAKFPGRVATIHGKLSDEEKAFIIQGMKDKSYDLMCASTLIEVGLTLNSLKAIVMMDADYFGLAQLHQLRGRVARKGGKGYCFLFPSSGAEEEALERLRVLEDCTDGYKLAERDMENRGFGNLDADAETQHGKTSMILWNAKVEAKEIERVATHLSQILASIA